MGRARGSTETSGPGGTFNIACAAGHRIELSKDANGNLETVTDAATSTLKSLTWSSFDKPVTITDVTANTASSFVYGPGRGRIKQTIVRSAATERAITYAGGLYEKHVIAGQSDELVHYIRAGNTVATFVKVDDADPATDRTRYLHRDHIGSVDLITGAAGAIVERRSYDPHGKPRAADWQPGSGQLTTSETRRGFTGHEHLDEVGLIHMNGRVYDPELGRFLSADPIVPNAASSQAFNRYVYVGNNPLSFTDPSGFYWGEVAVKWSQKNWWYLAAAVHPGFLNRSPTIWNFPPYNFAARYLAAPLVSALAPGPWAMMSILVGAEMAGWNAYHNGGEAGEIGAAVTHSLIIGAMSAGIGQAFGGSDVAAGAAGASAGSAAGTAAGQAAARNAVALYAARVVAHGLLGGLSSVYRGGKFTTGALAGAFTAAAGPIVNDLPGGPITRITVGATAGGIGAKLGGGKFKNGAMTGAFLQLMGEMYAPGLRGGQSVSERRSAMLSVVGKIWSLPNTAIGMLYGLVGHGVGLLFGTNPSITINNNAIQFTNNPLMGTAMALGNVIIYGTGSPYQPRSPRGIGSTHTLGFEESQHTIQGQFLGPLYLPAHVVMGTISLLSRSGWHGANILETGPHASQPSPWP